MPRGPIGGVILIAATYALAVLTFMLAGAPAGAAVWLGGTYALTGLAAFLFSRGVLEFFVGADRDAAFFVVLRKVTDPLIALAGPLTPGFLAPFAVSLYVAFLVFFLKVFLFGDAVLGLTVRQFRLPEHQAAAADEQCSCARTKQNPAPGRARRRGKRKRRSHRRIFHQRQICAVSTASPRDSVEQLFQFRSFGAPTPP